MIDKIINELEEIKENFRVDLSKHNDYNTISDTIELIKQQDSDIEHIYDDMYSEINFFEDEIYHLEEKIETLEYELKELKKES